MKIKEEKSHLLRARGTSKRSLISSLNEQIHHHLQDKKKKILLEEIFHPKRERERERLRAVWEEGQLFHASFMLPDYGNTRPSLPSPIISFFERKDYCFENFGQSLEKPWLKLKGRLGVRNFLLAYNYSKKKFHHKTSFHDPSSRVFKRELENSWFGGFKAVFKWL